MNERLYDIIVNRLLVTQHTTYFGQDQKKAPASASQTKIGHLNIERTEQPTDKHDKQLTIVSAKKFTGGHR